MKATLTSIDPSRRGAQLVFLLNSLATIQVVWFYLTRLECHLKLLPYEQGQERIPFQYRLLLMEPLRWAHQSRALNLTAAWLTSLQGFFPGGVRPEGIVEAAIDVAAVATAGLVAEKLYQLTSRTGLLLSFVYPLTLLMVMSTYSFLTMHAYRFIYDLPGLAFFSLGLYLIYARGHPAWFATVFLLGTLNRETTLLLVVFFILAECSRGARFDWKRSYAVRTLKTALPLLAFWMAWHLWVTHLFRANLPARPPEWWLNISILAIPFTWPQVLGAFSYLLPIVIVYRSSIRDKVLRTWLWALPVWFAFMFYYGVLVESRVWGELIAYIACFSALVAEEKILMMMRNGEGEVTELSGRLWLRRRA